MNKHSEAQTHAQIRAEIASRVEALADELRKVIAEQVKIAPEVLKGGSTFFSTDEQASRELAKTLLNGHAPASLTYERSSVIDVDRNLRRRRRALEIALGILHNEDLVARTAEAFK